MTNAAEDWPDESKKALMAMVDKYGEPNEMTQSMAIWNYNGPWKRTIVYKEEVDHHFPMPHKDVLEQVVNYRAKPEMYDDIVQYDGSVILERTKGEMSARCDKEEMNMLALNLAHEVNTGKRTVADARDFFAKTAMAFMKGEKPEYVTRLMFSPEESGTGDKDKPAPGATPANK